MVRLVAMLSILAGMLVVTAPTAVASPSPGGDEALWDGSTIPPLFGAIDSPTANAAVLCFASDEYGAVTVDGGPFCDGAQEVYYAAVGNAEDFGLGAAQTSVTVQNIDYDDAYVFLYVGNGNGWTVTEYAYLAAGASKTWTAADLGIASGTVVPVVAVAYHVLFSVSACTYDAGTDTWDCGIYGTYPGSWYDPVVQVLAAPAFIAGVAKQAVAGSLLPYTNSADTAVSGYNAVGGREVGYFDQLYLPIAQTNCGPGGCWDSVVRVANVGADNNAAVTVRFFPADDGSGSLNSGFQLEKLVDVGETWSIHLSDWVPTGWVGSVHIFSDDAVVATIDRFKAGTNMWISNTASNAAAESYWQFPGGSASMPYVLFAPDVRLDFNGWNTGINVANTVDTDNQVAIQYFGNNGNAPQGVSRRLAPHGMTYFYNPSDPSEDDCAQPADQVPTCDFVGAAVVLSQYPVATAVDGVKYYGNDGSVGHAFSYHATGAVYTELAAPLVQKGNASTGMGPTSGINFLNPNSGSTFVETFFINPSGFGADNYGPVVVWVPGFATGFVYTMFQGNLPNGFSGSALVSSELPIAATTANVDYLVQGDGTAIWNLYNPCGFFRQSGYPEDDPSCVYEAPVEPPVVVNPGLIVKTVTCPDCDVADFIVAGATVHVTGTTSEGDAYFRAGTTNVTGTVFFSVPPGTYDVTIVSVPDAYAIDPATAVDEEIVVGEGETVQLDNTVLQAGATKIIDTAIPGMLVCVYEREYDQGGKPEPIGDVEDCVLGVVEMPKGFEPGQGEQYGRLRQPTYDYLNLDGVLLESIICSDFEYLEDAELFLAQNWDYFVTNNLTSPLDINGDGAVDCANLDPIPYVRPETLEELAERLGAVAVQETDENGDAEFELPAGCYYAVISGFGWETWVEEFCLEPGETEVNEINFGTTGGRLVKQWVLPFFDEGALLSESYCDVEDPNTGNPVATYYTRWQCEQAFVNGYRVVFEYIQDYNDVQMEVNICKGADVAYEDCEGADSNTVYHGGVDDFNLFDLDLEIDLAVGDYTLCYIGTASYEYDNPDGTTITEFVDFGPLCETFTIETEEETRLLNFTDDRLAGVVDVYVGDGGSGLPLNNILVRLYDQNGNMVDWTCTDINGEAQFPTPAIRGIYEGNYTVTATDSAPGCVQANYYETQSGNLIYDVFGDWSKRDEGIIDDDLSQWYPGQPLGYGTPDIILLLDPSTVLDILTTVDDVPIEGVYVEVYTDEGDATTGQGGDCGTGTFVNSGFTDANGEIEFAVLPGNYCAIADPNGDGINDVQTGVVVVGDDDSDIDITIDEDNVVGVQTLLGGTQVDEVVVGGTPVDGIAFALYLDTDGFDDGACTPGALVGSGATDSLNVWGIPGFGETLVADAALLCLEADPNGDGVYTYVEYLLVAPELAGDIDVQITEENLLGVQAQLGTEGTDSQPDGVDDSFQAAAGVTVNVYDNNIVGDAVAGPGDQGGTCGSGAFINTGVTDANGFVDIPVGDGGDLCVEADINGDGINEYALVTLTPPDGADGEDVRVAEGSIIDVLVTTGTNPAPVAAVGVDVNLYAGLSDGTACQGAPLQTLQTDANGEVHFLIGVNDDGDYCVDSDPNGDSVFTYAEGAINNDPLDVLVTIDGVPQAGVSVGLFAADVTDTATDCNGTEFTAAPVSSPLTTDANGEVHFLVPDDGNYCIESDPNGDGTTIASQFTLTGPELFETGAGNVDVEQDEDIVFEVALTVGGAAVTAAINVTVHQADTTNDTANDCVNPVLDTVAADVADGVAQFLIADAGTYCFESDPNQDSTISTAQAQAVPSANGPTDDDVIDVTINEENILDVLVQSAGTAVGAGIAVSVYVADPGNDTVGSGGSCTGSLLGVSNTNANGFIHTNVGSNTDFCISADPDGDTTVFVAVTPNIPSPNPQVAEPAADFTFDEP
ncbi:MAG: hypothetical protein DCC58_12715 [Chloroflexi bacterium]|nr:MAG: hypothetical protein DCC58_12715 [Chloroflexota bacterium]